MRGTELDPALPRHEYKSPLQPRPTSFTPQLSAYCHLVNRLEQHSPLVLEFSLTRPAYTVCDQVRIELQNSSPGTCSARHSSNPGSNFCHAGRAFQRNSRAAAMARSASGPTDLLKLLFVALCATAFFSSAHAADPDPLADFCVADLSPNAPLVSGYPCKPRSTVTAKDFVYTAFRNAAASDAQISQSPTGAVVALASPQDWPGLNTQGVTHARLDFAIGGVIPLHTHPRAAETLLVLKGTIYTGFISDDNVLYASTLKQGDVILFPRALLHFQLNVGNETAVTFNTLTSQNPGILLSANQIFEPNITSAVIEKSFGIDAATVKKLKASYPGHP